MIHIFTQNSKSLFFQSNYSSSESSFLSILTANVKYSYILRRKYFPWNLHQILVYFKKQSLKVIYFFTRILLKMLILFTPAGINNWKVWNNLGRLGRISK